MMHDALRTATLAFDPHGEVTPLPEVERALLEAVVYASLFDYPLTPAEARETMAHAVAEPEALVRLWRSSARLRRVLDYRDGFFTRRGRGDLVGTRRRREATTRAFLARHRRLLHLVCVMPFTRLVALSGSAAALNCDERDRDLDLFIVTRGPFVWSVTLTIVVIARLLRVRTLLCANFVMADSDLSVEAQDLFTANQILHLRPLVGARLLDEFVGANPFVARFYPNFTAPRTNVHGVAPGRLTAALKRTVEAMSGWGPAHLYERACRGVYGRHLHRRAKSWESPEQVRLGDDRLKLHTRSHRHATLARFQRALRSALEEV